MNYGILIHWNDKHSTLNYSWGSYLQPWFMQSKLVTYQVLLFIFILMSKKCPSANSSLNQHPPSKLPKPKPKPNQHPLVFEDFSLITGVLLSNYVANFIIFFGISTTFFFQWQLLEKERGGEDVFFAVFLEYSRRYSETNFGEGVCKRNEEKHMN